jgi:hypothetical protein
MNLDDDDWSGSECLRSASKSTRRGPRYVQSVLSRPHTRPVDPPTLLRAQLVDETVPLRLVFRTGDEASCRGTAILE